MRHVLLSLALIATVAMPMAAPQARGLGQGLVQAKDGDPSGQVRARLSERLKGLGYAQWATLGGIDKFEGKGKEIVYEIGLSVAPRYISGMGTIKDLDLYLAKITLIASGLIGTEPKAIRIKLSGGNLCDDTYDATELVSMGGCNGTFKQVPALPTRIAYVEGRLKEGAGLSLARKAATDFLGGIATDVKVTVNDGYLVIHADGMKGVLIKDGKSAEGADFFLFRPTRERDERMDGTVTRKYADGYAMVSDGHYLDGSPGRAGAEPAAIPVDPKHSASLEALTRRLNDAIAKANR